MAARITPFQVSIPESALATLKSKLKAATLPDEVDFSDDWSYGIPQSDVKRLTKYWAENFDWRAQEAKINELPQFTTTVQIEGFGELEMHFVHQRSERKESIPLLFSHGWPGSFLEVAKILPLLTAPEDEGVSFHVVAPSLPNFGFSQGPRKAGFGLAQYAEAMHKVMINLGYEKYVTQGGDWGYKITRMLSHLYPSHILASHLNLILANPPKFTTHPLQYLLYNFLPQTSTEKAWADRTAWFAAHSYGYNLLQSTKPSTIGFALADSPVSLLTWISEKLYEWSDAYPWTDDEILTWISIYVFSTAGPAASVRIYYEVQNPKAKFESDVVLEYNGKVKLGLSYFPKDIFVPPKTWGRTLGPVVFESVHEDGGHFAAHERPEKLVGDLRRMFGPGGGAEGVGKMFKGSLNGAAE